MSTQDSYFQSLSDSRPSLRSMLRECKDFALRDYSDRGDRGNVRARFMQSVRDAVQTARKDELLLDSALLSLMTNIRLGSLEAFEADIDRVVEQLLYQESFL